MRSASAHQQPPRQRTAVPGREAVDAYVDIVGYVGYTLSLPPLSLPPPLGAKSTPLVFADPTRGHLFHPVLYAVDYNTYTLAEYANIDADAA